MIRRLIRGAGYVEGCGHHPGNGVMVGIAVLGFATGGWIGAAILAGVYLPAYLIGCWERADHQTN